MSTTSVTATNLQMDYMKLLVAQMQNQNPLEPLDNREMASQLAQFSQLQQLESMNSNFAKVLTANQRMYANSLIGKEISFIGETESGSIEIMSRTVEQVSNVNGEVVLVADDYIIGLEDIVAVKN